MFTQKKWFGNDTALLFFGKFWHETMTRISADLNQYGANPSLSRFADRSSKLNWFTHLEVVDCDGTMSVTHGWVVDIIHLDGEEPYSRHALGILGLEWDLVELLLLPIQLLEHLKVVLAEIKHKRKSCEIPCIFNLMLFLYQTTNQPSTSVPTYTVSFWVINRLTGFLMSYLPIKRKKRRVAANEALVLV